jgi:hypothetical protein
VTDRLFVGVVTGEAARHATFYDYLHALEKPPGAVGWLCHDRSSARGRNLIVDAARHHGCDRILFLDDDMAFPAQTLTQLAAHDVDVVSGLYVGRMAPHFPLIFSHFEDRGAHLHVLRGDEPRLLPIAAAGLGCCLVRVSVFDRLERPYFRLGELNTDVWSDDLGFFKRVQAAGIQSYCDLDCCAGHIGTVVVWPDRTPAGWQIVYDTTGRGLDRPSERISTMLTGTAPAPELVFT